MNYCPTTQDREEFQPYFLAYCVSTGINPRNVKARDGNNAPFMIWISQRWREWERQTDRQRPRTERDHADFDAWLKKSDGREGTASETLNE